MIVRRTTADDVSRAIDKATANYGGNLILADIRQIDSKGRAFQVKLRVESSKGPGAHHSAPNGREHGRPTVAPCWHAYRDFLAALFELSPGALVRTALAKYDGAEGFAENFPGTYYSSAGSIMYPSYYGGLCECAEWGPR